MVRPALTTVRQPKDELGRRAAQLLLNALNGEKIEGGIYLDPELVIRESCGFRRKEGSSGSSESDRNRVGEFRSGDTHQLQ